MFSRPALRADRKMIQECKNPIAVGDLGWIFAVTVKVLNSYMIKKSNGSGKPELSERKVSEELSENIAFQQFYEKYWERAIDELKIKYIQDGAEFDIIKKIQS